MAKKLEFELADNAFDFVLSAAEHTKAGSTRDFKYAILHLFAGIELLLKARLYAHDWTLIFANSGSAKQEALQSGDFKSVDFENACKKLNDAVGVVLGTAVISRLDQLRKIRNKIQHFEVAVDLEQAQSLLGFGTSFVVDFTKQQLPQLLESRADTLKAIHEHMREFHHFADERLASIKDDLELAAIKVECPRCWQETLVVGDYEDPKCAFCHAEFDAEALAVENSEVGAERCPECHREAAAVRYSDDGMYWFCYGCGEEGVYRKCPRCDNLMSETEGPCAECFGEFMSKDD